MGIQVKELTHTYNFNEEKKEYEWVLRKSWEKEFIDFEFDGKHVSEFGLVVVSDGDRLSMDLSAPFTDETSEVNGVDGQLFWGTKRNAAKRQFKLATDGMSWNNVAAFKKHFQPGRYGKLIEDSEFGKYCYARVADQPIFTHIPFKKKSTFNKVSFNTNEFKGEITITFVMDSPWKYGIQNYIEESEELERMVRLMSQYGIPKLSSWNGQNVPCCIGDTEIYITAKGQLGKYEEGNPFKGQAATESSSNAGLCFYNPSEVPCAANLKISFKVDHDDNYFTFINDENWDKGKEPYCRIIQSQMLETGTGEIGIFDDENATEVYRFCSPYVVYSMNQAISIIKKYNTIDATIAIELTEKLRDEIHHQKVLNWCLTCIRRGGTDLNSTIDTIVAECLLFFNTSESTPFTISINGENGECKCSYSYAVEYIDIYDPTKGIKFQDAEENCGDMTLSENLKLKGGNYLDPSSSTIASYYQLALYKGSSIDTSTPIKLEYKYTYL